MYLVTGGAGFIGSSIVRALADGGESVRVLDNMRTGHLSNLQGAKHEFIQGDVRDLDDVRRACAGVEVVFHQAAIADILYSFANPTEVAEVNTAGTVRVFEAARDAGVRRLVFASTSAVYGEISVEADEKLDPSPLSPYAASKMSSEHFLRSMTGGPDSVCLRYFNIYGPPQRPFGAYASVIPKFLWEAVRGEDLTVFGDGLQTRDFCHIDDVVQANLRAGESDREFGGQAMNIGTGLETSVNEVAGHVLGHPVVLEQLAGKASPRVRYAASRPGDSRRSVASIARAQVAIGFEPKFKFPDGLDRTAKFIQGLVE